VSPRDPVTLECSDCGGRAPLCDECHRDIMFTLAGTAWVRGRRWGESLNRIMPRPLAPWPAYDSDRAAKLQRICRRKVDDLARGDERTLDALARRVAVGAEAGYYEGEVRAGGVSFMNPRAG
jgi:hypothetical protein